MVLPVELDRSRPIYCENCIEIVREEKKNKGSVRPTVAITRPTVSVKKTAVEAVSTSTSETKLPLQEKESGLPDEPSISLSSLMPKKENIVEKKIEKVEVSVVKNETVSPSTDSVPVRPETSTPAPKPIPIVIAPQPQASSLNNLKTTPAHGSYEVIKQTEGEAPKRKRKRKRKSTSGNSTVQSEHKEFPTNPSGAKIAESNSSTQTINTPTPTVAPVIAEKPSPVPPIPKPVAGTLHVGQSIKFE